MMDHLKIMYERSLNEEAPGYEGTRNQVLNKSEVLGAEFRTIVASNSNVIYSASWLDLSAAMVGIYGNDPEEDNTSVLYTS